MFVTYCHLNLFKKMCSNTRVRNTHLKFQFSSFNSVSKILEKDNHLVNFIISQQQPVSRIGLGLQIKSKGQQGSIFGLCFYFNYSAPYPPAVFSCSVFPAMLQYSEILTFGEALVGPRLCNSINLCSIIFRHHSKNKRC